MTVDGLCQYETHVEYVRGQYKHAPIFSVEDIYPGRGKPGYKILHISEFYGHKMFLPDTRTFEDIRFYNVQIKRQLNRNFPFNIHINYIFKRLCNYNTSLCSRARSRPGGSRDWY